MRFSLYIHIPYCQAKCPYCDFNSYAAAQWPEERYAGALCREIRHYAEQPPWRGGEVGTIFFGGGTPSLFAAASIGRILDAASALWSVAAEAEITLEANPGTVSPEKLSGFRSAGVNRMSFGVQSFAPHHLKQLGRIHSADEGRAAVSMARRAGFDNVSLDLMFALPAQTLQEWESDLAEASALQPNHVSAYNLTYEEGTPFHQWRARGVLRPSPEEIEVAMFGRAQELLAAAGYQQYEISNYAQWGRTCRHNLNYWHSGPYLGVGAGAHSYSGAGEMPALVGADRSVTSSAGVNGWRWSNHRSPQTYLRAIERNGHARAFAEALDQRQARGEFVFLGLRCRDGFSATHFRERFGADLATLFPHADGLRQDGLLECVEGRWRLTARGLLLADSVFATFL
jgi:oxygen-independent coproporphyrinogen-3 oxidase